MNERTLQSINLALRFVLEMVVLVALFLWGTSISDSLPLQILFGLGFPLVAIVIWGLFVAPRASRRLPDPARLVLEIGVFGMGVLAFILSGNLLLGALLAAAAALSLGLMFSWGQRGR
jgi:hypothetical protein